MFGRGRNEKYVCEDGLNHIFFNSSGKRDFIWLIFSKVEKGNQIVGSVKSLSFAFQFWLQHENVMPQYRCFIFIRVAESPVLDWSRGEKSGISIIV